MEQDAVADARNAIVELLNDFIYRDTERWDELLRLFHADGRIEIGWFQGPFTEFVAASRRTSGGDVSSKHVIGRPLVMVHGMRAIAETNVIIVGDNRKLGLGFTCHARFYDEVEQRDGSWRISLRQVIYDMSHFNLLDPAITLDQAKVGQHPREYAALAYVLDQSGLPIKRKFATKGSDLEAEMRAAGDAWLKEETQSGDAGAR